MNRGRSAAHLTDDSTRARALGALFFGGGTIALLSLSAGVAESIAADAVMSANRVGVASLAAFGFAISAVLLAFGAAVPRLTLMPLLALGSVLAGIAIYLSPQSGVLFAFCFGWVGLYAAYFFSFRQAALQIGFAAIVYVFVLVESSSPAPGQLFVVAFGTVIVAALLVGSLRRRVERLVEGAGEVANNDALTGLLNRRGFEELIRKELARAKASERPLSVIVGNIDNFKQVNQLLGHDAGDETLVRAANVLEETKRPHDTAARTGGEEFALLAPEIAEHDAYLLAEQARSKLHEQFRGEAIALTISFGVASFPKDGASPDLLVRGAERGLNAAKQLGCNRSVIYSADLVERVSEATSAHDERSEASLATVLSLAEALDICDSGTALHSETVGRYAEATARGLHLPSERVERIRLAGIVHDVGKIGVSDALLRKPTMLDEDESAEIRKHPEIGARLLGGKELHDLREWVIAHHERPDGQGYPRGLSDDEISLEAKILAVADAYEAMTARRSYSEPMPPEAAQAELRRRAGTQFDSRVVETFLRSLDREGVLA